MQSARCLVISLSLAIVLGCANTPVRRRHSLDEQLRAKISAMVHEAEAARLLESLSPPNTDGITTPLKPEGIRRWINIVVSPAPVRSILDIDLVEAHNSAVDPAWVYVVGIGPDGALYRIRGFAVSEYSQILRWRRLRRGASLSKADAVEAVRGYFEFVEGWSPGLITSRKDKRNAPSERIRAICGSTVSLDSLPRVTHNGGTNIQGVLFDSVSGRTECVDVALRDEDLIVTTRTVVSDRRRIDF